MLNARRFIAEKTKAHLLSQEIKRHVQHQYWKP